MRVFCILDGETKPVLYDAATANPSYSYDPRAFEYMGEGLIYSVQVKGVEQRYRSTTRLKFYKLRKNRPRWAA